MFVVEPEEQGSGSLVRVGFFRRLQKCVVEVLALSIPKRYVVILTTMWDRIFGCCSLIVKRLLTLQKSWQARSTFSKSGGNKLLASLLVNVL